MKSEVKKYNKIFDRPMGNLANKNTEEGAITKFAENHLEHLSERSDKVKYSDFDNYQLIKQTKNAIKEYKSILNNSKLQGIISAAGAVEEWIIKSTARSLADAKKTINCSEKNGEKKEWMIARTIFPTNNKKNQIIRVYVGVINPATGKVVIKEKSAEYSKTSPELNSHVEKLLLNEIESRMNENGTIQQLLSELRKAVSNLDPK